MTIGRVVAALLLGDRAAKQVSVEACARMRAH
jgi:hypothetical protein